MKLSHLSAAVLALATACGTLNANASMITYETRSITDNTFLASHDYQAGWAQQSSSVSSNTLGDFYGQVPGSNSFSHLALDFDLASAANIIFQLGLDAGYGGEIRADGALSTRNSSNLWWGYSWNNTAALLATPALPLAAGHHVLDAFWSEDCCGGWQAARFSTDNGATWLNVSTANLDRLAVPEPGMLALMGIGLAGLATSRRRKKDAAA